MADDNGKITYFLAGLGIGALIGILFAPRSGEETRDYISKRATEGRDYVARRGREVREQAGEYVAKGKETAADYIAKGKEAAGEYVAKGKAAVEAGKQAYREASGRGEPSGSES